MTVSHIISGKSREVVTAEASESVLQIAGRLAQHKIGAVVIVENGDTIKGIVSERDIVRVISSDGAAALSRRAETIMTKGVKTCNEADSEAELMSLMTENRIRHLPVVRNNKLVAMVSIGDVVKYRMLQMEHETDDLKTYIASAG